MEKKPKKQRKPKTTKIYAIVNLKTQKIIDVFMRIQDAQFEYEVGLYDPDKYDIAEFDLTLSI